MSATNPHQTNIYLDDEHRELLASLAKTFGMSKSAVVREALETYSDRRNQDFSIIRATRSAKERAEKGK